MLFSHPVGVLTDGYMEWLNTHEEVWHPEIEQHRHGALKTWFSINQKHLDNKEYGKTPMPRFTYGMFNRRGD